MKPRHLPLLGLLMLFAFTHRGAALPPEAPWLRAGVVVLSAATGQDLDRLGSVWYYQYGFGGPDIAGHTRVYVVPVDFSDAELARAVRANPDRWWLVGNEPNDPYQDNLSPSAYAAFYHRAWTVIRRQDGNAHVVPAGIANADWQWAEAYREAYRVRYGHYPQLAAWNIHNYILDPEHSQYDLALFQQRILAFHSWMEKIGDSGLPLLLTEYGVLYVEDVAPGIAFLHEATLWLQQSGIVQAWAWFSLDSRGQFNGDLSANGRLTDFGSAYRDLIRGDVGAAVGHDMERQP